MAVRYTPGHKAWGVYLCRMNPTPNELKSVIGKTVFRAWRGHQRSMFFEFGEKLNLRKGEFSICIDSCPWRINLDGAQIITDNNSYWIMDEMIARFVGRSCTAIQLDTKRMRTTISFSGGCNIQTSHKEDADQWYLLTPQQEITIQKNCSILVEPAEKQ